VPRRICCRGECLCPGAVVGSSVGVPLIFVPLRSTKITAMGVVVVLPRVVEGSAGIVRAVGVTEGEATPTADTR